jgi:hypothetical protein
MNDVEERLRNLGARVEARAARQASPPTGFNRRVRRRQFGTAAVAMLAVAAVASLSVLGIRWADQTFRARPAGDAPLPGPGSETPNQPQISVGRGTGVGPAEIEPTPEDMWAPISEPVFLGGERVFGAEWRLYAWRAASGFVGWQSTQKADGERIAGGGSLVTLMPPCRLMPGMLDLESKNTEDVQRWLLFGYVAPEVSEVRISFGGRIIVPEIYRLPPSYGAPFDMYAVAVDGVSVEWQSDIALATTLVDASGQELDRGPLRMCLSLGPEEP